MEESLRLDDKSRIERPQEQARLFGLGAVAAGSPGVKLEVIEIKVSRSSSFTVTIRSGTKRKIKGEIYGCL